ncbi:hypothetical protein M433DRAFT_314289 [Acidomyces richmondensis BFW]|nr:MAG: hypothetical protein FE78DRAFT_302721 [Acidomyces sp. 'richmondensis']KYG44223.1 hypothetical protein M433DRAFT_314289 [Acidomyces richmondensis BFW]
MNDRMRCEDVPKQPLGPVLDGSAGPAQESDSRSPFFPFTSHRSGVKTPMSDMPSFSLLSWLLALRLCRLRGVAYQWSLRRSRPSGGLFGNFLASHIISLSMDVGFERTMSKTTHHKGISVSRHKMTQDCHFRSPTVAAGPTPSNQRISPTCRPGMKYQSALFLPR